MTAVSPQIPTECPKRSLNAKSEAMSFCCSFQSTPSRTNELGELDDVTVRLISGFPSIEFAHVVSPLSHNASWATFFQELARQLYSAHTALSNVASQVTSPNENDVDPTSLVGGDGVDLHYRDVGTHSFAKGDTLTPTVARGEAPYERIVEWIVPDTRNARGRVINRSSSYGESRHELDEGAWDAGRFENPLGAPMTTGPAAVFANGRFQGERLSPWVAPGEQTTLRINKALNIRTRSTEQEEPNAREEIRLSRDWRAHIAGELLLVNHRAAPTKMIVKRRFSGELLEADREPLDVLLEEGAWSVNDRHELIWTIDLAPGETRALAYRYRILVKN
jgi:hypothetical protein